MVFWFVQQAPSRPSIGSALKANGQFKVRALTRDPSKYQGLADEVAAADKRRSCALRNDGWIIMATRARYTEGGRT